MASDALPENLSAGQPYLNGSPPQSPPTSLASALMLQTMYSRLDSSLRGSPAGSSDTSPRRDGPHTLPPPGAFSAAALCDQFCSVINGFRGYDPRLKSASSSRAVAAEATECKLIDYRGEKIAAFEYRGEYLLCLPQAFELFLRHLVGGLHTVYTKLKRLGISPIVCNVEQVRVLRGLGAIQPGVNRCKLLSCKDFDCLYKDCTTARPGRPPRRASLVGLGGSGYPPPLLKPGDNPADYDSFKSDYVRGDEDGDYNFPAMLFKMWSQGQQAAGGPDGKGGGGYPAGLGPPHVDPSFSMLGLGSQHGSAYHRHLLSGGLGLPLASIAQAHLGRQQDKARQFGAGMDLANSRNPDDGAEREKSRGSDSNRKSRSPAWPKEDSENAASALNLSQNGGNRLRDDGSKNEEDEDEGQADSDYGDEKDTGDLSEDTEDSMSSAGGGRDSKLSDSGGGMQRAASEGPDSQLLQLAEKNGLLGGGIGSIETLLQNILGLLKVAEENARRQEQRVHMERAELKVEILRERELREGLEKKLQEEQSRRLFYQKRLRREKRCRRQVQDQLEGEVKKRARYEEALRTTLGDSQIPKETLQEETKSDDTVAMESDNSVKSR